MMRIRCVLALLLAGIGYVCAEISSDSVGVGISDDRDTAVISSDSVDISDDRDIAGISSDSGDISGDSDIAGISSDSTDISADKDAAVISSDSTDISDNKDTAVISSDSTDIGNQNTAEVPDSASRRRVPPPPLPPPPPIKGTFAAFNVGLSIGSIPIFASWQSALPTSISDLGLSSGFGADLVPGDTANFRYSATQAPDQFNFVIPFGVSIHRIYDDRSFSFALSMIQNRKQYQAEILIGGGEEEARRINMFERMTYSSISIEAAYQWSIPQMFFSVDGAQQTFLFAGIGVSPINSFTRLSEIKNSAPDDERMAAAAAVIDSARAAFPNLSANGWAFTWRVGINTLKSYRHGGGLEMGLFYSGSYSPGFSANGESVTQSRIDGADRENDKPISFMSSRIEFRASFLRSITKKREVKDD